MNFEVRIPIGCTDAFFRQVEYLWRSFMACGGLTATARFIVFIADDVDPFDVPQRYPWARGANIEWRFADRDVFRRIGYMVPDRLTATTNADLVLYLDSDTVLVRSIDDLLVSVSAAPVVAGVIAHVPPFMGLNITWEQVYAALGYDLPKGRFQHLAFGEMYNDPANRFSPVYYNFGFVLVPGAWVNALGQEYLAQLALALERAPINQVYKAQLAFGLAIHRLGYPHVALEAKYNFPNLEWADRKYVVDLADIRVLHYLGEHVIGKRSEVWASEDSLFALLRRNDLMGSNEILRSRVASLVPSVVRA